MNLDNANFALDFEDDIGVAVPCRHDTYMRDQARGKK